jgi:hypothetical protein
MSSGMEIPELCVKLQGETSEILPSLEEFNLFEDRKPYKGLCNSGKYQFELKTTPSAIPPDDQRMARTMKALGATTTLREQGEGSRTAVSRNVHIALSIWHVDKSTNITLEVLDRIRIENLWEQAQRELGRSLAIGTPWQLWQGDRTAQPPPKDWEEYGLVPAEIPTEPVVPQIAKRDIDFTSEIRKHGKMVTVKVSLNGTEQTMKVTPESSLSHLLRRHTAVPTLPEETVFNWGTTRGTGKPGAVRSLCSFRVVHFHIRTDQ